MVTSIALLVAVIGFWALRRDRRGAAGAVVDAGLLALTLACSAAGAWIMTDWRGSADGTSGALAGVILGTLLTDLLRDVGARR